MKVHKSDRRASRRYVLKTSLRIRGWKSPEPEQRTESLNLSPHGVYFATNLPFREGATIEVLFEMPEEIAAEPTAEWRCTGHLVRVERVQSQGGGFGVGVRFDCYEVSRARVASGRLELSD
jgi:PilZ domain